MSRVYKTKDGSHDFYSGVTKVASIKADGSFQDINGITLANDQDIQNAAADKASYYFGAASNFITSPADAKWTIGTSDFTVLATLNSSSPYQLVQCGNEASATYAGGFGIRMGPTTITYIDWDTAGSYDSVLYPAIPAWQGKPTTFAISRKNVSGTGRLLTSVNGNLVSDLAMPQITNINNASNRLLSWFGNSETGSNASIGTLSRAMLFNYALSAEKIARYSAGAKLDYEDVGGGLKNTVVADQDFSSNTGYWTFMSGVSIVSQAVRFNGASGNAMYSPVDTAIIGKKYRTKFKITARTGGNVGIDPSVGTVTKTRLNGVEITTTNMTSNTTVANDVWEFEYDNKVNRLYIAMLTATDLTIDDVFVYQLGAVLDLEPEGITTPVWADSSGNGLNGKVTGALASSLPSTWKSYSIGSIGGGGNAASYFRYRVINGCIDIAGTIVIGSTLPSGTISFGMPTDFVANYSSQPIGITGGDSYQMVGHAIAAQAGTKVALGSVVRNITSNLSFIIYGNGATYGSIDPCDQTFGTITFAAGDTISVCLSVPL